MYGGRAPKGELCNKVCMYVCMYVMNDWMDARTRKMSLTRENKIV